MDAGSTSGQVMDESVVGVALKEESDGRFAQSYIEDICPATFGKVFLPIDSHEVDFTDEMVKLELESQSGEHHIWAAQLATTTLCEQDDCGIHGNPSGVESAPESSGRDSAVDHEVKEDDDEEEQVREEEGEEEVTSSLENEASLDRDSDKDRRDDEDAKPDDSTSKFYKIQCTICKKWFLNNDSMITHLRNHCGGSGAMPSSGEQCQVCQQTFHDGSSLHAHMLSHVGANPIECNLCQKRFAYKWCLRNHASPTSTSASNATGKSFDNCCPTGSNVVVVGSENVGILPGGVYAYESVEQARKLYEDRTSGTEDVSRLKDAKSDAEPRSGNRCEICRTRFKDRESLDRHAIVHANETGTAYKYDLYASTLFRDKVETPPRASTHASNAAKQFKCALCERSFSQRTALNNHMLAHSGEKPHACNICEKTYKRKSELIRHTMVHTGERPYECKECLMTFREKAKLNSHMLVHTGEKPHECYICHKACARKSDLNSHMLSHTGGQYDCKVCDKIFTRKSDLNRHTLIHTGEKPFACEHCDMAFRERTRLNSHMLVHTGDKRHACHICGKSFREKSSLKKHMLVHTGDRPYECYICKKSFTQKTTLNSHVLVHTGGRATDTGEGGAGSYECDACPKSFRDKSSLRKHSLFHANERVHECNVCFKQFPHKAALGTHAAIDHPS